MKELLNIMIISNNSKWFYLWWKKKLLRHDKSQNIMKLIVDKLVNRDIKQLKNSLSATKVSRNDEKMNYYEFLNLKKTFSAEIKTKFIGNR